MKCKIGRVIKFIFTLSFIILLSSCAKKTINTTRKEGVNIIKMIVNEVSFDVELSNNKTAIEFYELIKNDTLELEFSEYGGFEKIASLGVNLTTSDERIKTEAGDIILYNASMISIMYGTNTWSYTRLGKIKNVDKYNLKEILNGSNLKIKFIIEGE